MKTWQKTDQGMVRKENQDFCMTETIGAFSVAVVCDGMGGAKAGAVASQMAAESFLESLHETLSGSAQTTEDILCCGLDAVKQANSVLYERSRTDEDCYGMGTTLVAVIACGTQVCIFNVGDSRAYLINAGGIRVITRDHSVVQDMVEHGDITEEEARSHPNRNLITRALGTESNVCCDTFPVTFAEGDHLLLCSDGLVNTVGDQEILYEVIHEEPIETCLDRLVSISLERGAPDNVTAILMKYEKEAEQ